MDRAKLAQLRKKKAEQKLSNHKELLESNASIKEAIVGLSNLLNDQEPFDDKKILDQIKSLGTSMTFSKDVKRLETALATMRKEPLKIENFQKLIDGVGSINHVEVVKAVNALAQTLQDNTISQDPKDFQPVRRVIKLGSRFVFDDDKMQVSVMGGGGGGGGSSIPAYLIEDERLKVTLDGLVIDVDTIDIDTATLAQEETLASIESNTDLTAPYLPVDTDNTADVKYYGFMKPNGAWYIMKQDNSTDPKTYRYASGPSGYDFDDRASLTYELPDVAFGGA